MRARSGIVTYSCDGCPSRAELSLAEGKRRPPDGWAYVTVQTTTKQGAISGQGYDLCPLCVATLPMGGGS